MSTQELAAPAADATPSAEPTALAAADTTVVAAIETPAVTHALPTVEAPATAPLVEAVAPTIEPPPAAPVVEPADIKPETIALEPEKKSFFEQYALLAASLALAAMVGALAGAAATVGFPKASAPPAPATKSASSDEVIALKASVAQLGRDIAAVKSSADAVGRSTAAQIKVMTERFEKAQAEPAAKLAKISESLDRLERRTATAAPAITAPATTTAAVAPAAQPQQQQPQRDITGSITPVEKTQAKPPTIEGWKLVDAYGDRVVLQSRVGALYEVRTGSTLPGIGRVESIKRADGRIVVSTPKGIIVAAIERHQPSPQYYQPYRY